jgi:hypothetical protein
MREKIIIEGKVEKKNNKKFKIKAHKSIEIDVDIEIIDDGNYQVDKLSVDTLPATMPDGKTPIKWLNHFSIKKGNNYVKQPFKVTIPGLGNSKVVILDTSNNGNPHYFSGQVVNDTIQLNDGDPGIGQT